MTVCPHSCRFDHVTLDVDGKKKPLERVDMTGISHWTDGHWRPSSGRKGHHLILCIGKTEPLIKFAFRLANRDDIHRVRSDLFRYSMTQKERYATGVLFDMKRNRTSGEWQPWQGRVVA